MVRSGYHTAEMPEEREGTIQALLVDKFVREQPAHELLLLNIWADATRKEIKASAKGTRASQGMVYPLESSSTVVRGKYSCQVPVYPPAFANLGPIRDHKLQLCGAKASPRNVVLLFSNLAAQVQLLTHTTVQIFSRSDWQDAVCMVPSDVRGYRVGVAFEFARYTMAFVTLDQIFAVHWASKSSELPCSEISVVVDFPAFVASVVQDFMEILKHPTDQYLDVGLPPGITEAELVDVPDVMARVLLAYYQFARVANTELWSFVQRRLHGYMLTASDSQRVGYTRFLHVWGKTRVQMTRRAGETALKYSV
ncbi:hypothetical protein HWV62_10345 [Athelia sp. TMB]|nr:hypothetical protein HWV62_10345 [Athelia sp. TMB]